MNHHDAARIVGESLGLDNPRAEARLAADLASRCECPNCERGSLDFHAGVWTCDLCEYTREHDGLSEDGWPVHGSQA